MTSYAEWTVHDAAKQIAVPTESDDKYSRGVLGVMTGSAKYPGAAVLGVEAALRTGVGMVRYIGPGRPTRLVLARRPEAVTSEGRVQAWLVGSGTDDETRDPLSARQMTRAVGEGVPVILDGGALDLHDRAKGPVIITPHYRELARVLGAEKSAIAADPAAWTLKAADELGVTVLLKGHATWIAGPGIAIVTRVAPNWLATAGAGDALAGILGALVATHAEGCASDATVLAQLAASATVIHGLAAERASGGGPFTILDLAESIPPAIAALLAP